MKGNGKPKLKPNWRNAPMSQDTMRKLIAADVAEYEAAGYTSDDYAEDIGMSGGWVKAILRGANIGPRTFGAFGLDYERYGMKR